MGKEMPDRNCFLPFLGEERQILGDRGVELDRTFVDEQQDRSCRRDGLGERREIEDRPPRHRNPLGLQYRESALGKVFERFTILGHSRTDDSARNLGARDGLIDFPFNPSQLALDRSPFHD
jgi:hypothetical protein